MKTVNAESLKSAFGYHTDVVQEQFQAREVSAPAQFLIPYLEPGLSLLDCGCGPGPLTQGLAQLVAPGEVVGCDLEPRMVARAERQAAAAGLTNLRFQVGDILGLPFPDDTFDVVFSSAVTEHLADPGAAVKELARVAKPGGLVAIYRTDWTGPLVSPDCDAMDRFFELLEAGFQTQGGTMNGGRHLRWYCNQAGLQPLKFFPDSINATEPQLVKRLVSDYVDGWRTCPYSPSW